MSKTISPLFAVLSIALLEAAIKAKTGGSPAGAPSNASELPEELRSVLPPELVKILEQGKCDDPTCPGCNPQPTTGDVGVQAAPSADASPAADAQAASNEQVVDIATAQTITPELARLVGMSAALPADSLEMKTRAMAAGFILNLREMASQPEYDIQHAITRNSALKLAENRVLQALQAVNTVTQ